MHLKSHQTNTQHSGDWGEVEEGERCWARWSPLGPEGCRTGIQAPPQGPCFHRSAPCRSPRDSTFKHLSRWPGRQPKGHEVKEGYGSIGAQSEQGLSHWLEPFGPLGTGRGSHLRTAVLPIQPCCFITDPSKLDEIQYNGKRHPHSSSHTWVHIGAYLWNFTIKILILAQQLECSDPLWPVYLRISFLV